MTDDMGVERYIDVHAQTHGQMACCMTFSVIEPWELSLVVVISSESPRLNHHFAFPSKLDFGLYYMQNAAWSPYTKHCTCAEYSRESWPRCLRRDKWLQPGRLRSTQLMMVLRCRVPRISFSRNNMTSGTACSFHFSVL